MEWLPFVFTIVIYFDCVVFLSYSTRIRDILYVHMHFCSSDYKCSLHEIYSSVCLLQLTRSHLISYLILCISLGTLQTGSVINMLKTWFNVFGWPRVIRSDGGPQFRGEFSEFCKNFRISHELSSPYNPHDNGLAESGVKIVMNMLHKCLGEGKDMQRVLYEWRNLPKQHGLFSSSAYAWEKPATATSPAGWCVLSH